MKRLEITNFPPLDYAGEEAINTLATNLSFAGSDIRKVMITSCQSGEGKSFLSMNLMRTLAGLGKRVVLVDADLRKSCIASCYGLRFPDGKIGLAHYLAGMNDINDTLYATNIPNTYMVPVGRLVSNSLSLLNTPRLSQMLDYLSERVDLVLVDAAPVGMIIDAAQISKSCDGTLIAVHYNRIHRRELLEVRRQIEQAGSKILGCVLNEVEFESYSNRKYYNKSYYSYYASDEIKTGRPNSARSSHKATERKR